MIYSGFVISTFGQFLIEAVEALLHLVDMGERFAHFLGHGDGVGGEDVLGQVADGDVGRHGHRPGGGCLQSGYDFEHSGFAGTVFAHQSNAVAVIDYIADVVEERTSAEFYRKIID